MDVKQEKCHNWKWQQQAGRSRLKNSHPSLPRLSVRAPQRQENNPAFSIRVTEADGAGKRRKRREGWIPLNPLESARDNYTAEARARHKSQKRREGRWQGGKERERVHREERKAGKTNDTLIQVCGWKLFHHMALDVKAEIQFLLLLVLRDERCLSLSA